MISCSPFSHSGFILFDSGALRLEEAKIGLCYKRMDGIPNRCGLVLFYDAGGYFDAYCMEGDGIFSFVKRSYGVSKMWCNAYTGEGIQT